MLTAHKLYITLLNNDKSVHSNYEKYSSKLTVFLRENHCVHHLKSSRRFLIAQSKVHK